MEYKEIKNKENIMIQHKRKTQESNKEYKKILYSKKFKNKINNIQLIYQNKKKKYMINYNNKEKIYQKFQLILNLKKLKIVNNKKNCNQKKKEKNIMNKKNKNQQKEKIIYCKKNIY
ncbi:hypothetical protein IMG5_184800 [Ichthyophthirius multifiliis]|uniref:Uncharacterized protein n=1 Tax=Ichthyophthirius multifiliis TaxID=5932 RepID=G0R3D6_ICHMU|nr:hypothetical protein IMG5_184800 [Ichthyophthirius multifiliis]EGR28010.1 hypothetical protein IMG5_184800 [Ichthyophthirius multifiliis]|eukprot:XP_004027355.1 hypothetical protein IMG5_184800 [Ichthyophthirius multifiliis]